jgi:hypothetical protein
VLEPALLTLLALGLAGLGMALGLRRPSKTLTIQADFGS